MSALLLLPGHILFYNFRFHFRNLIQETFLQRFVTTMICIYIYIYISCISTIHPATHISRVKVGVVVGDTKGISLSSMTKASILSFLLWWKFFFLGSLLGASSFLGKRFILVQRGLLKRPVLHLLIGAFYLRLQEQDINCGVHPPVGLFCARVENHRLNSLKEPRSHLHRSTCQLLSLCFTALE